MLILFLQKEASYRLSRSSSLVAASRERVKREDRCFVPPPRARIVVRRNFGRIPSATTPTEARSERVSHVLDRVLLFAFRIGKS